MIQTTQLIKQLDAFIAQRITPLDARSRLAIIAALLLLPALLFYFLIFSPKSKEIHRLQQQRGNLRAEVDKARNDSRRLRQVEQDFAATEEQFATLKVMLPEMRDIPDLLRSISNHGREAGLEFISFKPGAETPKDFFAEIPIDITVRGPYHFVGQFLDQVRKLDRIVTVHSIDMGAPKREGGEVLLSSRCRLTTYRFTNAPLTPPPTAKKR